VAKGRELLEQGDLSSAVEYYGKAFDPDSVDENEARSMLIEARSHLARKHFLEALESFEEALLMGTEVQRRQALEGIFAIGQMRSRLGTLRQGLQQELDRLLGVIAPVEIGLALVGPGENIVLISTAAVENLPGHLTKGTRISRLPQHLTDHPLPIEATRCIPYADEEDVRYIIDVATELVKLQESQRSA